MWGSKLFHKVFLFNQINTNVKELNDLLDKGWEVDDKIAAGDNILLTLVKYEDIKDEELPKINRFGFDDDETPVVTAKVVKTKKAKKKK